MDLSGLTYFLWDIKTFQYNLEKLCNSYGDKQVASVTCLDYMWDEAQVIERSEECLLSAAYELKSIDMSMESSQ